MPIPQTSASIGNFLNQDELKDNAIFSNSSAFDSNLGFDSIGGSKSTDLNSFLGRLLGNASPPAPSSQPLLLPISGFQSLVAAHQAILGSFPSGKFVEHSISYINPNVETVFTHRTTPSIIGIPNGYEALRLFTTEGSTSAKYAVAKLNGHKELAIRLERWVINPSSINEEKSIFVSEKEISLNRNWAELYSPEQLQKLFPGKATNQITKEDIIEMIENHPDTLKPVSIRHLNDVIEYRSLPIDLVADVYGSQHSTHNVPEPFLEVLDQNKAFKGNAFTSSHTHFNWTKEEWERGSYLNAVASDEKIGQAGLLINLSPGDMMWAMGFPRQINDLSKYIKGKPFSTNVAYPMVFAFDQFGKSRPALLGFSGFDIGKALRDSTLNKEVQRVTLNAFNDPDNIQNAKEYYRFISKESDHTEAQFNETGYFNK